MGRIAGNLFLSDDFRTFGRSGAAAVVHARCIVDRFRCAAGQPGLNGLCSPAIPVYRVTDADCRAVRGVLHLLPAVVVS